MRYLLCLCLPALATAAGAAVFSGEISAVDSKAGTVTVMVKERAQTFRVRPDTLVTVNGARMPASGLAPKMIAKVTANDPTVAQKVEASAAPTPGPAPVGPDGQPLTGPALRAAIFGVKVIPEAPTTADGSPMDPLSARITDTKWRMNDGKTFTLNADGTTSMSWHTEKGKWKATGEKTAEWTIASRPKHPDQVTFDANLNTVTWKNEFNQAASATRIAK